MADTAATDGKLAVKKVAMPPHRLDELHAEQIAGFYRNSTPGTVGGMIAAPILTGMLLYENAVRLRVAAISCCSWPPAQWRDWF